MWLELFAVSLWGGLVALDTTAAFQIMISQPLVACSIVGLLLGNFQLGFIIGIYLQLIWMGEIPAGAAFTSEGNIGACTGAAIAILSFEHSMRMAPAVAIALLLSIGIAFIGGKMVVLYRTVNSQIYQSLINADKLTIRQIEQAQYLGLAGSFLLGTVLVFVFTLIFGYFVVPAAIHLIPKNFDLFVMPVGYSFLGVGTGVLLYYYIKAKNWWLFGLGLLCGAVFLLF